MGLLTCARCGCSMTAEMKKGKYVYYRCTGLQRRVREHLHPRGAARGAAGRRDQAHPDPAEHRRGHRGSAPRHGPRGGATTPRDRCGNWSNAAERSSANWIGDTRTTSTAGFRKSSGRRKSAGVGGGTATVDAESPASTQPRPLATVTAAKILELAKKAEFLYKTQNPAEQRRLLETVLSNCTFDRGSLCPTYSKPFDLFVRGNETGDWRRGWDSNPRELVLIALPRKSRMLCSSERDSSYSSRGRRVGIQTAHVSAYGLRARGRTPFRRGGFLISIASPCHPGIYIDEARFSRIGTAAACAQDPNSRWRGWK